MNQFVYKCTDFYNPTAEISIAWNDPDLGIEYLTQEQSIQLSGKRSMRALFFTALKIYIVINRPS